MVWCPIQGEVNDPQQLNTTETGIALSNPALWRQSGEVAIPQ